MTYAEKQIANAIGESIRDTKIVTLEWAQELEDALTLEACDYVDANGVFEAWGEPANDWRVHLRRVDA
jgi:hypothetical protein